MKKLNILTPIVTIGSLGAIVTPMTVLTSCGNKGSTLGGDADLTKGYTPKLQPKAQKIYKGSTAEEDCLKDYFADNGFTNNNQIPEALVDDVQYSYSEAFKTDTFKSFGFVFDSYTLKFENITGTVSPFTLNTKFIADATGSCKSTEYGFEVTEGKFHAEYEFHKPFKIEMKKADDTTWKKLNYLKFYLDDEDMTLTYTLTGSFKYNGEYTECPGKEVTDHNFLDQTDVFGFVTDLLVIEGLTCNSKVWQPYGVVYTNYYKNMVFED